MLLPRELGTGKTNGRELAVKINPLKGTPSFPLSAISPPVALILIVGLLPTSATPPLLHYAHGPATTLLIATPPRSIPDSTT